MSLSLSLFGGASSFLRVVSIGFRAVPKNCIFSHLPSSGGAQGVGTRNLNVDTKISGGLIQLPGSPIQGTRSFWLKLLHARRSHIIQRIYIYMHTNICVCMCLYVYL